MAIGAERGRGSRLAGYRIERLIGRGGMSEVYLADDLRLGRKVALKLLAPALAADERFRERFLRESRVAASLDHSRVVPVYEAGEADGQLYIAMRYVEGTTLTRLLEREGRLEPERALDLAAQVAGALDHAHAHGLVHRDVKPGNVLVAREGADEVAYLADFGITMPVTAETAPTHAGGPVGTAEYMAPEQIEGKQLDGRADVYALGCVLFECLTGRPPFRSESLMGLLWAHVNERPPLASALRPGLPPALDRVLARALAKAPERRHPSCRALVEDARAALGSGRAGRLRALAWRRRTRLVAAGIATAALAGAAIGAVVLRGEATAGPTATPRTDSLQRIDPRANALTQSIPLGAYVSRIASGAGALWALAPERGSFLRIDSASGRVVGLGSTLGDPASLAAGLGGLWIANRAGSSAQTATLLKVDPALPRRADAFTLAATQRTSSEDALADVAVSTLPESRGVWVTSPASLAVQRLRSSGTLAATIRVGPEPARLLAVAPGAVWFTRSWSIGRIDPAANRVAATVELPFVPRAIAADARAVWLANGDGNTVWQLDARTERVVRRIRVGREPSGIALGFGSAWVTNRMDGTVTRIDAESGRVVATIPVGGEPEDVTAGADRLWVVTHVAPSRRLSADEFGAELRRILRRFHAQRHVAFEPGEQIFARPATNRDFRRALVELGPAIWRSALVLEDRLARELGALTPPVSLRADHERYLAGLARVRPLTLRVIDATARQDHEGFLAADNDALTEWVRIRTSISAEYEALAGSDVTLFLRD